MATDRVITQSAVAYLIARERLAGATGAELTTYAIEVDDALHTLTNVCGYPCDGCDCSDCTRLREEPRGDPEHETPEAAAVVGVRVSDDTQLSDRHAGTRTERARTRGAVRNERQLPNGGESCACAVRESDRVRGPDHRHADESEEGQMILDLPDVTIRWGAR